ncbi:13471_t:CDS:2 [Acaulospora colombiana]|uniref:13471_t:CDS:1 n=1 Tax=Acaulospora colombiana TaxID=27376 RepID=A0ACA9KV67_9GLOM|nr:13471_t:CDS:2 [Acaulospora colombiana]
MNNKQAESRSLETNQGNVANLEDCPSYTTTTITSNISKFDRLPDSAVEQKSLPQDTKQKVPYTQKYQLQIRKSSQRSPDDIPTPSPPIGAHSGLLPELTFDQGKGQFLWAPENYQGNLRKRRMNINSPSASPKPYDKVPRPPNAFIIYHKTKSKELSKYKSKARSVSDERHPSKTVAEMWREEPEEIKLYYQREADLALVEHKKKYPYYKYKPKKKDGKNKGNSTSSPDSFKDLGPGNSKEDSQVPMEHRKQASMESAFTVFDLRASSERQEEKVEEAVESILSFMPEIPEYNQSFTPSLTTVLEDSPLTAHILENLENSMTPAFSDTTFNEAGYSQFNDNISSNNEIGVPTIANIAPDVIDYLLTHWNLPDSLAGYIVPPQDTQASSITLPSDSLQELPPTPTSPINVFPYSSTITTDIQCANQPQSLHNIQQLFQLQFQPAHPNE